MDTNTTAIKLSNRPRSTREQQESPCRRRIGTALEIAQANKKGLNCQTISSLINCLPNFLGCFAQDTLPEFIRPPCTLLVNVDSIYLPGSHWIALGLFKDTLEIFDPLGFNMFLWESVPCDLLRFLHRYGQKRKVLISKRVQPLDSYHCGFYSMFYVFNRTHCSFDKIQHLLHSVKHNEHVLNKFFS